MTSQDNTLKVGMIFISMIFFIFGFVTTFIISLSGPVKEAFELTFTQAFLVNSAFFISYAIFSIPAGGFVKKIGYKNAIVTGLLFIAVAGFLFFPAIRIESYPLFLGAIFILSIGVVLLQTAANPYVAVLGPAETASGRLNLTQALNSIATWIAPLLIVALILKSGINVQPADLLMPFIFIGIIVFVIAIAVKIIKLPTLSQEGAGNYSTVFKHKHTILGAVGIFCYVGAEVGIGTAIASYIVLPEVGGVSSELAMKFVGLYWAGAMIGRFFGAISLSGIQKPQTRLLLAALVLVWALIVGYITLEYNIEKALIFFGFGVVNFLLMQLGKGKTNVVLSIFAAIAALMALVSIFTTGQIALWTIVSIGMFNSVMFPNIFSLAVKNLDKSEVSLAAGIINTLIVGGAIIPLLMGLVSDRYGIQFSFILPVLCYLYILYYALVGSKVSKA